jgi:UDP-N-acetylmuramyl pentapeptide phosphotransferase/UDP-N-acetylglucosamine-1-phosphate transferase
MAQYSPLFAAFVTLLLTFILMVSKAGKSIQDIPNERSLHDTPVPRVGGIGMMAGIFTGWAVMVRDLAWWVVVPALFLVLVSLLDDVKGLPVRQRFFAHVLAATLLVFGSGLWAQNALLALLIFFFAVWMTNLYNFMDGSDGLAGGMAFFGFTIFGLAMLMHGDYVQAMMSFSIGAAAVGFLYHNFPPAKVFMGDSGSITLGFLVAALGVLGWQKNVWPLWFPVLVFSPFIVDATVTLLKRGFRGAKVTEAHREHYYQRVIQMGVSHRDVALIEYGIMLAVGVSALYALGRSTELVAEICLVWAAIYTAIFLLIDRQWRQFQHCR